MGSPGMEHKQALSESHREFQNPESLESHREEVKLRQGTDSEASYWSSLEPCMP